MPCGMCRQVLVEFCDDLEILLVNPAGSVRRERLKVLRRGLPPGGSARAVAGFVRLLLVLAGALAGCQLIIGEIEPPQVERPEVGADAAPASDAAVADAVAPDATPTLDAAGMHECRLEGRRPAGGRGAAGGRRGAGCGLGSTRAPRRRGSAVDVATLAGSGTSTACRAATAVTLSPPPCAWPRTARPS
ncbi:MAG: hypothetical protein R3F43_21030 [bacterium]